MKIREIVSEAPAGDIGRAVGGATNLAAKGIGAVAGGAVAAPKRIVKGVSAGAAAFDKLMSPSQWFKGKDDPQDTDDTDSNKTNDTTVAQYTDSLNAVAQNMTPNAKDIGHLKQLASRQGFSPEEQAVLKAAYSGQQLDTQQRAIIKQITAKL
jgi:hypothetical protein